TGCRVRLRRAHTTSEPVAHQILEAIERASHTEDAGWAGSSRCARRRTKTCSYAANSGWASRRDHRDLGGDEQRPDGVARELERETRFELATSCLEGRRSATELLPRGGCLA